MQDGGCWNGPGKINMPHITAKTAGQELTAVFFL